MKKGFTLAEVLITIAIIGVVAVLTVPMLIQKYEKHATSAKLKKFVSTMEQAIRLSEIENGSADKWETFPYKTDSEGRYDYDYAAQIAKNFFVKYLAPYMNYTKIEEGGNLYDEEGNRLDGGNLSRVYLSDGGVMDILPSNGCADIRYFTGNFRSKVVDGKSGFAFLICPAPAWRITYYGDKKTVFGSYAWPSRPATREEALARCQEKSYNCSSLLEYDNWEFKDDYPYKL